MAAFTLEQLDMVRRLKQSGLSKDDILMAFDSFDATEKELGSTFQFPASITQQIQTLQAMALSVTTTHNHNNIAPSVGGYSLNSGNINNNSINLSQDLVVTPVVHTTTDLVSNYDKKINGSQDPMVYKDYNPTSENNINNSSSNNNNNIYNNSNNTLSNTELITTSNNNDLEVDKKEFHDFIRKGEVACCEEIRQFATKHNVKQQQIATLAGICQSYVSRYMKGDIYDMSERSRRSIQKWFLVYRHNPASITYAVNAAQHLINMNSSKRPCSLEQLDFTADSSFPRRERFVFRAGHLEILERYFQDNNYPLYETREKIAHSCNLVTQNTAGRELTEREKVTTQIISNWFANKRKELKKLAKEEGLMDITSVPVRPRGHPSRVYSDLIQHSRHSDPPSYNNNTNIANNNNSNNINSSNSSFNLPSSSQGGRTNGHLQANNLNGAGDDSS